MTKPKSEIIYYPFVGEKLDDEPFNLKNGSYSWTQQLRILANKNDINIHTPDMASYDNVIGVLFFDNLFYRNVDGLMELNDKGLLGKTIYIDYEPPTGHAKKHEPESIKQLAKLFKSVVTYDDDLAGTDNFIKGNVANYHADKPSKSRNYKDRKMVCMVTSNTTNNYIISVLNNYNYATYYNERNIKYHPKAIYHKRIEIADYFLKNHPESFDLYGLFWPDRFETVLKGFLEKNKKIQTLSEYKFAITFDSYTKQRGYISEKIFDAFFAGTIPVYMGADNVLDYIPEQCFIDARDFKSYDELYDYLSSMSESEFNKRQRAIGKFLYSKTFTKYFSSAGIAKTLLAAVQDSDRQDYKQQEARAILDQLVRERARVMQGSLGVINVDKVQKDDGWNFLFHITTGHYRVDDLVDNIYAKYKRKTVQIRANPDHYVSAKAHDVVSILLSYEDLIKYRKIEFFVKLDGRLSKLPIFTKRVIEATDYDDKTKFLVSKNTVFIPKTIHKKLRSIYSRYNG